MPSIRSLYNDELVEAHREAVAALRELLAQERDPAERRKLANAILRARPAKEATPGDQENAAGDTATGEGVLIPSAPSEGMSARRSGAVRTKAGRQSARVPAPLCENRSVETDAHDLDDADTAFDDDLDDPLDREIDELSRQITRGPDPLAALNRLRAIMIETMATVSPSINAADGS